MARTGDKFPNTALGETSVLQFSLIGLGETR